MTWLSGPSARRGVGVLGTILGLGWSVSGAAAPKAAAPDVTEIRAVYKEVEGFRAAGKLKKETAPMSEFEEASLFTDAAGRARLYVESLGGQDSVVTVSAYYDAGEKLRFVFCQAGAVNESKAERRYYLGSDGKIIDQKNALIQGEGYPWDWENVEKITVFGRARSPRESFKRFASGAEGKKETVAP